MRLLNLTTIFSLSLFISSVSFASGESLMDCSNISVAEGQKMMKLMSDEQLVTANERCLGQADMLLILEKEQSLDELQGIYIRNRAGMARSTGASFLLELTRRKISHL